MLCSHKRIQGRQCQPPRGWTMCSGWFHTPVSVAKKSPYLHHPMFPYVSPSHTVLIPPFSIIFHHFPQFPDQFSSNVRRQVAMLRVLAPLLAALAAAGNATELDSTSDIAEVGTLREAADGFSVRNWVCLKIVYP